MRPFQTACPRTRALELPGAGADAYGAGAGAPGAGAVPLLDGASAGAVLLLEGACAGAEPGEVEL